MAPKHAELPIFLPANFYYKTFTVGIKSKNLPRTTRFGLWCFIKVFYKTTICPRQPLLRGPKSGLSIQVWNYKYPACIFIFYYVLFFWIKVFLKQHLLITGLICDLFCDLNYSLSINITSKRERETGKKVENI